MTGLLAGLGDADKSNGVYVSAENRYREAFFIYG